MRYVRKQAPPNEYTEWFYGKSVADGKRQDCSYEQMRTDKTVIEAVELSLITEQKYVCCYTGIVIDIGSFHVEHIKPQTECIDNEDVDYENLLAAFPAPNTEYCPFGAEAKGSWHDPSLFISPLDPSCGMRFRFLRDGTIEPSKPEDEAASKTIEKLRLNHKTLVRMRRQAISKFKTSVQKLSMKKLEAIASRYSEDTGNERLPEFCFVIQQFAPQELKRKKAKSKNRMSKNIKRKRRK